MNQFDLLLAILFAFAMYSLGFCTMFIVWIIRKLKKLNEYCQIIFKKKRKSTEAINQ